MSTRIRPVKTRTHTTHGFYNPRVPLMGAWVRTLHGLIHGSASSTNYCVTTTTNAHAPSTSHLPTPAITAASGTSNPVTVDEHERTSEMRPPHALVERPRPPDTADDEVKRMGAVEVEVGVSRGSDGVEVAVDTNGDDQCRPDLPTEPPGRAEESAEVPDESGRRGRIRAKPERRA